jgi:hypothetical protein
MTCIFCLKIRELEFFNINYKVFELILIAVKLVQFAAIKTKCNGYG